MKLTRDRCFIDTNILVYAVDTVGEPAKSVVAGELIAQLAKRPHSFLSVQVKAEFASLCIRKLRFTPAKVASLLQGLKDFSEVNYSTDILREGLLLMDVASLSFWDAVMIATAKRSGCTVVYTEDLNHGQVIEGVRIHNPFLEVPNL